MEWSSSGRSEHEIMHVAGAQGHRNCLAKTSSRSHLCYLWRLFGIMPKSDHHLHEVLTALGSFGKVDINSFKNWLSGRRAIARALYQMG
jgi:hypothetical protein